MSSSTDSDIETYINNFYELYPDPELREFVLKWQASILMNSKPIDLQSGPGQHTLSSPSSCFPKEYQEELREMYGGNLSHTVCFSKEYLEELMIPHEELSSGQQ